MLPMINCRAAVVLSDSAAGQANTLVHSLEMMCPGNLAWFVCSHCHCNCGSCSPVFTRTQAQTVNQSTYLPLATLISTDRHEHTHFSVYSLFLIFFSFFLFVCMFRWSGLSSRQTKMMVPSSSFRLSSCSLFSIQLAIVFACLFLWFSAAAAACNVILFFIFLSFFLVLEKKWRGRGGGGH